ncbi:MAG: hypothetical protein QOH25_1840 [Acidobacteriota bacterium]|jgi:hypothetical protein|nr:hypothetical protein [Acidobacteriota bacterium]
MISKFVLHRRRGCGGSLADKDAMRGLSAPAAILLLLLGCCAEIFGQDAGLQLTTNIISQRLCRVNASGDALQMTLQLRYTNTGRQKLILYKGNRLFYQIFISSSGEAAAARRNELRMTHARYYDEQPERIVSPTPGSVFTILSPGSSYETRQIISVPVAREGEGVFNVSISAGEHVLHLTSSTWYESKKIAEDLRERWRGRGFLWTDPLASNSVALVVDKNRPAAMCQ